MIFQLKPEHLQQLHSLLLSDPNEIDMFVRMTGFMPSKNELERQFWCDPDYDSELILGAFKDADLIGFCVAVRRPWKSERKTTGFIKWIYVAPGFRGQCIGSQLLQKVESVMQLYGVTDLIYGSSAPQYLWPGVSVQDHALQALLDQHGWIGSSERINLNLPLPFITSAISTRLDDIEISIATADDKGAVDMFINSEFTESWGKEIEPVFQPEHSAFGIMASCQGKIIGFAAIHATNPNWFGPMVVSASYRGRGVGKLLLLTSINKAAAGGTTRLIIPWVNELFYNKCLGLLTRQVFIKYRKIFSSIPSVFVPQDGATPDK